MTLYEIQEETIKSIDVNLGFYMQYSTRINVPFNDLLSAIKGAPLDKIWNDINKSEFLRDFTAKLSSKILSSKFIIELRKKLLKQTKSVLVELHDDK
jgi:hypothetical protein